MRSGGYGASDLYISIKDSNDLWTDAQNMGNAINSNNDDFGPWVSSDGQYFFFCSQREDDEGYNPYWADISVLDPLFVSVKDNKKSEMFYQSSPNPFINSINIEYEVVGHLNITIQIVDQHGKVVRSLVDEVKTPGNKSVTWDGADNYGRTVSTGVYICVLKAGNNKIARNLIKI